MTTTEKNLEGTKLTLGQRASELGKSVKSLRAQYNQACATPEFGAPAWSATRKRKLAQRQLAVLVPLYRTLTALAQQGKKQNPRATARYVYQLANVLALVDSMVGWVDGTEAEEFAELLSLRVPQAANALYDEAECFSMTYRLSQQRTKLYARQAKVRTLVTKLLLSLSDGQRELINQVHKLTGGDALRVTPSLMLATGGGHG